MLRRLALWLANRALSGAQMQILDRDMPVFRGTIEHVEERRDMREQLWLYAVARSRQGDIRGVPIALLNRCRARRAWIYNQ